MEGNKDKPEWEKVALSSRCVKMLRNQWFRLAIHDELLKQRFEAANGSSEHWQIVWPASMNDELPHAAHRRMSGDRLRRRKTAAAIQTGAYRPTWSSDLDCFLGWWGPCVIWKT